MQLQLTKNETEKKNVCRLVKWTDCSRSFKCN